MAAERPLGVLLLIALLVTGAAEPAVRARFARASPGSAVTPSRPAGSGGRAGGRVASRTSTPAGQSESASSPSDAFRPASGSSENRLRRRARGGADDDLRLRPE